MLSISNQRQRQIDQGRNQDSWSQHHRQAWKSVMQDVLSRRSYHLRPNRLVDPPKLSDSRQQDEQELEDELDPNPKRQHSLQCQELLMPIHKKTCLNRYDCFYGSLVVGKPSAPSGGGDKSVTVNELARNPYPPGQLDRRHSVGVHSALTLSPPRVPTTSTVVRRHNGQYQKHQQQHLRNIGGQNQGSSKRPSRIGGQPPPHIRASVPSDFRPVYDLAIRYANNNVPRGGRPQLFFRKKDGPKHGAEDGSKHSAEDGPKHGTEEDPQKALKQAPKVMINQSLEADMDL